MPLFIIFITGTRIQRLLETPIFKSHLLFIMNVYLIGNFKCIIMKTRLKKNLSESLNTYHDFEFLQYFWILSKTTHFYWNFIITLYFDFLRHLIIGPLEAQKDQNQHHNGRYLDQNNAKANHYCDNSECRRSCFSVSFASYKVFLK